MNERRNYWPKDVTMPVVLPQPVDHEGKAVLMGCVCPPEANRTCDNPLCPRKDWLKNSPQIWG